MSELLNPWATSSRTSHGRRGQGPGARHRTTAADHWADQGAPYFYRQSHCVIAVTVSGRPLMSALGQLRTSARHGGRPDFGQPSEACQFYCGALTSGPAGRHRSYGDRDLPSGLAEDYQQERGREDHCRNEDHDPRRALIPPSSFLGSGHRYARRAADEGIEFVVEFTGGR